MTTSNNLRPIRSPRGIPLLGHTPQIPSTNPVEYFGELSKQFPEGIYGMDIAGIEQVFVYDPDLVAEISDETRFFKQIEKTPLHHVRDFAGAGLFTAHQHEEEWGMAHRVLMPAFSQRAMKAYYGQMLEIAQNLVGKWERREGQPVRITDDYTRLTLDTIALSGFGYRFQSFDEEELHPFLNALLGALVESLRRSQELPMLTKLRKADDKKYRENIRLMQNLVESVIKERRQGKGSGEQDLLGLMLEATDPETGKLLADDNVRDQVLTFLIAGHETTSGLLSFAMYSLMRNPHVLAQAYAEVDRLMPGDTVPDYDTIMKLDVIPRILDETLRLWAPIPAFGKAPIADTVIGGRYELKKGTRVNILEGPLHTHPKAWERPEEFDIDRWLPENRAQHHPHAYKPFGNGVRACIGRQFALTEARLALALVLQKFKFSDTGDYKMDVNEALTRKPSDFELVVRTRQEHERTVFGAVQLQSDDVSAPAAVSGVGVHLTVAYGSSLGSCEDLARTIADRTERSGFGTTLTSLDELGDNLPTEGLLVVVAASYNGKAPDNAQRFDDLIAAGLPEGSLSNVRFALLGAGNTQWVATYQAFPTRIEEALLAAGATPVVERGIADAAGDFDGMASRWMDTLWATLAEEYAADTSDASGPRYQVQLLTEADVRPAIVSEQAYPLTVVANEELVADATGLWDFSIEPPRPSAKSITIELPEGVTYDTGNHLAVFAKNEPALVDRTLARLGVDRDQVLRLEQPAGGRTHLPVGTPVTAGLLLTEFLELQDVATRTQVRILAEHTDCPWTRPQLEAYAADAEEAEQRYQTEILAKRVSVLGLLERFTAVELPLGVFLEMMGPIRPRFYSISSAPLADPRHVRLTVGLLEGPALSGDGQYRGTCSSYIAGQEPGDVFYGYVRVPSPTFAPPADPATPLLLIGPGTGIAPLRGFLEERARQHENGTKVGLSQVFVGCRHPEHDYFYRDEMQTWEQAGIAQVHSAFSAVTGHPARFVQNAIANAADTVWQALQDGAYIYVCGDGRRMAPAVREALAAIYRQRTGGDDEAAQQWLVQLEADERYQQDVFA
ncbi:bifunctional cytochrome P450/NADPH--P450 reductase [Rhodococcus opacus]|uniref:bifunctional cytochrome P450/NADPH--P450 reductase n=1 Tax=Rhodococcus TaxID=1827 RepID=UPI0002A43DA6|nr:cytochrome P450 [Rhodococcus opacus]ELB91608.1 cytochrome P450 [Rhodococcus wratislaviensis IFP 2016]NHU49456.1 cytochrome P450 [Rhodococcus sp. A14]MDV6245043.1 cytochrome P450 [Rhodococcus opacus]MDX5968346.1 cytochrome P450 [Rhodococcus opacus]NKY76150.1 cytochrome P450 [Rhodococcus opacus]